MHKRLLPIVLVSWSALALGQDFPPGKDGSTLLTDIQPGVLLRKSLSEMSKTPGAMEMYNERLNWPKKTLANGVIYSVDQSWPPALEELAIHKRDMRTLKPGEIPAGAPDLSKTLFAALSPVYYKSGLPNDYVHMWIFGDGESAILLRAWNFVRAGHSVIQVTDYSNTKVGDIPATFVAQKSSPEADKLLWQLHWITPDTMYELKTIGDEGSGDAIYSKLMDLAHAL